MQKKMHLMGEKILCEKVTAAFQEYLKHPRVSEGRAVPFFRRDMWQALMGKTQGQEGQGFFLEVDHVLHTPCGSVVHTRSSKEASVLAPRPWGLGLEWTDLGVS